MQLGCNWVQRSGLYAVTPLVLADLASVLPFYLPFTGLDLRFIRIARVFRLLRLAKLARYSEALRTVINVGRRKKKELMYRPGFLGHGTGGNHAATSTAEQASFRAWAGVR